ncbi:MAG: extracellular solute-binding protein [Ruminiclostridium sp.]|nr:extracellular solute-binding protein [Ruminiclostridium sp.]
MKKKILTSALALACVLTAGSCGGGNGRPDTSAAGSGDTQTTTAAETTTTTPPATLKEEDKAAIEEIETDFTELENKTVTLLANFDLNPAAGKPKSVALEMFESKCGGKIESILCSWDDRYDKLSTMVLAGDSPDMFSAEDLDIVPGKIIEGKFQAMDPYIDYDSELWAPTKDINDQFSLGGKHYVGVTSTDAGVVVIYNKKTIEENGLPDPAQLLDEGNWTWDTFYDMMSKFCSRPDEKFGIDGWEFENAFAVTSGVPYVGLENDKLVSNLENKMIVAVQEYMLNLKRNDMPVPKSEYSWTVHPEKIASGKTLFYPQGAYVLYEPENVAAFGEMEDIMFVPMPKCPDADNYYLPAVIKGFSIPAGAKNPEGAAAYLNCVMTCRDNEKVKEIEQNQIFEDYKWTQDMYDMLLKTRELTEQHPVFEYYKAVNDNVYDIILNPSKESYNQGIPWAQTVEEIKYSVQSELDDANKKLAEIIK